MAEKTAKKKKAENSSKVSTAKRRAAEKARLARAKAAGAKENVAVVAVNKQASGFIDFIRNQGVVGLAVGLAIGAAAGATVKTIVEGFVTPIVVLLTGTRKTLESSTWHIEMWGREADFKWGAVLSSLITLLATVFVIYLIVHFSKLDRLKKQD